VYSLMSYYQSLSAADRVAYNAKNYQKAKAKKVWPEIICTECHAKYIKPDGYSYKYCSKPCKDAFSRRKSNDASRIRRSQIKQTKTVGISFFSIYKKSNGMCACCLKITPVELRGSHDLLAPEIDHILPISCGGAHIEDNLQILCKGCNLKKGNRLLKSEIESLAHLSADSIDIKALAIKNLHHPRSNNTSGYKGVTWNKAKNKWTARCHLPDGMRFTVGSFINRDEAGSAVMMKRMEIYSNG
jgi:hypothetical protein